MKIQIDLDEELVMAKVIESVKNSFSAYNGAGARLVVQSVESYLGGKECEEKVKAIVTSTADSITKKIIEEEVADAVSKIARKHARRQAELREAEIVSAVGKQMELKGSV